MADLFDHAEDIDETPNDPVEVSDAAPVAEQPVQKAANANEEDMTAQPTTAPKTSIDGS